MVSSPLFIAFLFHHIQGLNGLQGGYFKIGQNMIAEFIRNWWTSSVIFCGHFTENAQTFDQAECENESRGEWYYRQILGSSNFEGSRTFHILTGHLSCQIEHHLYPDVPAYHYVDMAKQVKNVCKKYDIPYNTGSFLQQYITVVKRIVKYSFPSKQEQEIRVR